MELKEYQKLALLTENKELSYCDRIFNCIFGLIGEVGEYTDLIKKNIFHDHLLYQDEVKKELGDILWYSVVLLDIIGYNTNGCYGMSNSHVKYDQEYFKMHLIEYSLNLSNLVGKINNIFFEKVIYRIHLKWDTFNNIFKLLDDETFEIYKIIKLILINISDICDLFNTTMTDVMKINIEKLKTRYPNGFSSDDSTNQVEKFVNFIDKLENGLKKEKEEK